MQLSVMTKGSSGSCIKDKQKEQLRVVTEGSSGSCIS